MTESFLVEGAENIRNLLRNGDVSVSASDSSSAITHVHSEALHSSVGLHLFWYW